MNLAQLLKTFRIQNGFTQDQLAKKIFVSHQTISKWENGINTPSIDNLLALSDLYDISLDQLIRGSFYFRKPFVVGKNYRPSYFLFFALIWLGITLFLTGFGYQPLGVFLFVLMLGLTCILPTLIKDFWIIDKHGLTITLYPKSTTKKFLAIGQNSLGRSTNQVFIPYKEILSLELIYTKRVRVSPFDFNPDIFFINLITHSNKSIILPISNEFTKYIPQAMSYIEKKEITIIDSKNLIPAIVADKNLFTYTNK